VRLWRSGAAWWRAGYPAYTTGSSGSYSVIRYYAEQRLNCYPCSYPDICTSSIANLKKLIRIKSVSIWNAPDTGLAGYPANRKIGYGYQISDWIFCLTERFLLKYNMLAISKGHICECFPSQSLMVENFFYMLKINCNVYMKILL
jgi:hypothetical protein